jgi:acetolactate synthase regulatory subunit
MVGYHCREPHVRFIAGRKRVNIVTAKISLLVSMEREPETLRLQLINLYGLT